MTSTALNEKVHSPKHYNRENAMECIDEMILLFSKEEVKAFCKLNAWKYRYRAADKNGLEDLEKSDWYLKKYRELTDNITISTTHPNNYSPWITGEISTITSPEFNPTAYLSESE